MKKTLLLLITLAFATLSFAAQHDYNPSDSPTQYAYDSNTYTENSWTDIVVSETDNVTDVVVAYTWNTDTWASEGSFWLESPAATSVEIASGQANGTYEITLSDYSGEAMNGTWKLWIEDSYGDGGHQATGITVSFKYVQAGAPGIVTNPSPADGATSVSTSGNLTWDWGADTETYDLWFGPAGAMVEVVTGGTAGAEGTQGSYSFSGLSEDTSYEWQLILHNTQKLDADGPVWSFLTQLPTGVVQIGMGTATNQHLPIESFYGYNYTQTIYLSSDFGTPGADKRIEKIWYNYSWSSSGDADSDDWVIYMGTTANTNLDGGVIDVATLTEVFDGDVDLELVSGTGWLEIDLDAPFIYNPATDGNLVVAVDENTPSYTGSSDEFLCDQDTRANVSLYYYQDSGDVDPVAPSATASGASAYYPNTRFFFDDVPADPVLLVTPDTKDFGTVLVGETSASQTFTIRNDGGGTLNVSSVSLTGTNPTEFTLTDGNGYPAALGAGASITVDVTFDPTVGGAASANLTIVDDLAKATTDIPLTGTGLDPMVTTLPYTQNFDGVTAPALPPDWTTYVNTANPGDAYVQNSTTNPVSTPNNAVLYNYADESADLFLISPPTELNVNDTRVKFWAKGSTGYELTVGIMTDPTDPATFTAYETINPPLDYTYFTVYLDVPNPRLTSYVAFKHGCTAGYQLIYIDDFRWEEIPNILEPTDLVASGIGITEATLDWTENASTTTWDIEYGSTGFEQGTGTRLDDITTKPYPLTGLTSATGYDFYVRSQNALGGNSGWSDVGTFTTSDGVPVNPIPANGQGGVEVTSRVLTWDDITDASYFLVDVGTTSGGTEIIDDTMCMTNSYTNNTDWSYSTTYYWTVTTVYDDGSKAEVQVPGSEWTFTTLAAPITSFPFTEDFESGLEWPTGWVEQTSNATGWFNTTDGSSTYWTIPAGDGYYACSNDDAGGSSSDGSMDYLITPPLDFTGLTTLSLLFDSYFTGTYGQVATVEVSTDMTNWTTLYTVPTGTAWETHIVDISAYAGQTIFIGFHADDGSGWASGWAIDNVSVKEQYQHDVGTLSIDMGEAVHAAAFTPQATVKNYGANTETFDVTMTIGAYSSTKTVTDLATGLEEQVTFDSWTPVNGTMYSVDVTTGLATDMDTSNDTQTQDVVGVFLDVDAYADAAFDPDTVLDGPATFNLQTPGTVTGLATSTATNFIAGACWVNGTWYGTEYDDGTLTTDILWTIDHTTGAMTQVGHYGNTGMMGLAYDENTGTAYTSGSDNNLYTIDLATGATTLVGQIIDPAGGSLIIGIAYDHTGDVLYGVDLGLDQLVTIDTATGAGTVVGSLGIDINYAQDCAFDNDNGNLFLAGYTTDGALYWIDTATGGAYKIDDFQSGAEMTGFAIPYTPASLDPVTINSISHDGTNVTIDFTTSTGATTYNVYSDADPYGTFSNLAGTTATPPYVGAAPDAKMFYQVKAANGSKELQLSNVQSNLEPKELEHKVWNANYNWTADILTK